jgi:hypothetical protein
VWNCYGPTEATVACTAHPLTGREHGAIPIGSPCAGDRVLVVVDGRLADAGEDGELWVAGAHLARGYVGEPALTAEQFVETELAGTTERVYKTGDIVRWLPTGELEYVGRNDDQVKIHGYRVETLEVAHVLRACRGVRDAFVEALDGQLVAYVRLDEGSSIGERELRRYATAKLPPYACPERVHVATRWPTTSSGKLDRVALRALASPPRAPASGFDLRAFVQARLQLPAVDPELDLRSLGASSLFMASLKSALRAAGCEISLGELFAPRTFGALEAFLAPRLAAAGSAPEPTASARPAPPAPSAATRERISPYRAVPFVQMLANPSRAFSGVVRFSIDAILSERDIERAWARVCEAFPVLRTAAEIVEDREVHLIVHPDPGPLRFEDWRAVPPVLEHDLLDDAEREEVQRGVRCLQGETARLRVAFRAHATTLFVTFSSALFDGGSLGPLVDQLLAACRGEPVAAAPASSPAVDDAATTQVLASVAHIREPLLLPRMSLRDRARRIDLALEVAALPVRAIALLRRAAALLGPPPEASARFRWRMVRSVMMFSRFLICGDPHTIARALSVGDSELVARRAQQLGVSIHALVLRAIGSVIARWVGRPDVHAFVSVRRHGSHDAPRIGHDTVFLPLALPGERAEGDAVRSVQRSLMALVENRFCDAGHITTASEFAGNASDVFYEGVLAEVPACSHGYRVVDYHTHDDSPAQFRVRCWPTVPMRIELTTDLRFVSDAAARDRLDELVATLLELCR